MSHRQSASLVAPLLLAALIVTGAFLHFAHRPAHASTDTIVEGDASPVLIELFTSQGCSSCPPADRLAARLDRDERFVVLSRPVDYWDRLGWKDTFASPANTALQRAYARRGLAGYNGVYTPQSVIAGVSGEVGSDEAALRRLIAKRPPTLAALSVKPLENAGEGSRYAVGLAGKADNEAEVLLVGVRSSAAVSIGRGENRGSRITYTNVVLGEKVLTRWDGGRVSLRIEPADLAKVNGSAEADRFALIVREPGGGRVLAASWLV